MNSDLSLFNNQIKAKKKFERIDRDEQKKENDRIKRDEIIAQWYEYDLHERKKYELSEENDPDDWMFI